MTNLPSYIQQAVDLGLLSLTDGKISEVNKEATETIIGISRIVEKIQPTTTVSVESTTDQEAIVLCRTLSVPSGVAKELWSELRISIGVGHDQPLPASLFSTNIFRAISNEIDRTFLGERNSELINRESLVREYQALPKESRIVDPVDFVGAINTLSAHDAMDAYGDSESEWGVALDLLRQSRVKAIYRETMQSVIQSNRADTKIEKTIEFQQQKLMECLGMLRGSIGQQGNAKSMAEMLFGVQGRMGLIDKVLTAERAVQPVSTSIPAIDIDMEGGVYPPGTVFNGGRLFTLAARTGVGKTVIGANIAVGLAKGGLKVGFISAELDEDEIWTRISASATRLLNPNTDWASVGQIKQPQEHEREKVGARLSMALGSLQQSGGEIHVEAPWGADVMNVVSILRSMKAKNPDMRAAVIDHFHCLARHRGAPSQDSAMMEDRAYKLMTSAKELGIDLIVLAQMNRVGMDPLSSKSAPTLDQIRGTDALAHVSHAVWIVRKQIEKSVDQDNNYVDRFTKKLELWHAKTRGRQAIWQGHAVKGIKERVDCSILDVDFPYCVVATDNTLLQVN